MTKRNSILNARARLAALGWSCVKVERDLSTLSVRYRAQGIDRSGKPRSITADSLDLLVLEASLDTTVTPLITPSAVAAQATAAPIARPRIAAHWFGPRPVLAE